MIPERIPGRNSAGTAPSQTFFPPARYFSPAHGGQALDAGTHAEMSARFGHDFSRVRVHTDAQAGQAAASAGAKAYTQGDDIVFGEGRYAPGCRDGDRLLAHELTHVVQQARSGPGGPGRISRSGDASEREAEQAAEQALSGERVQVQAGPDAAIARDPEDQNFTPANPTTSFPGDTEIDMSAVPTPMPGPTPTTIGASSAGNATPFYLTPGAQLAGQVAGNTGDISGLGSSVVQGALEGGLPGQIGKDFGMAGQVEGVTGGLGAASGVLSIATGLQTLADPNAGTVDKVVGGANVASGGIGLLGSFLPSFAAGGTAGLAAPVTGAGAGIEGIGAFAGTGAAIGSAGAVLGAGAAGYGIGTLLANHTEVGGDTVDTLGGIDHMLGGTEGHSRLLDLDDYRQQQWDQGGVGGVTKAIGAGIGEGAIGLAGALGGLATGAWHGLGALAEGAAAVQG